MKHIFFIISILICTTTMATNADSTLQRHAFSISMANGCSQQFFDGPGHRPTNFVNFNNGNFYSQALYVPNAPVYLPMYSMHLQVHYSLGLTPFLRLETGIGYLLSGSSANPTFLPAYSSATYIYYGSITLPLYLKFIKPMPRGAFTCTLGPDFCLPVHGFNYTNSGGVLEKEEFPAMHAHAIFTANQTGQMSTMGLYLKMGYEKKLRGIRPLSINVGPVVDFNQFITFHTKQDGATYFGYHPYQFYTGLDVALTFGLKK